MLTRIDLRHFKCFESLKLPLCPLTLLSGANASGKSSVMQAFALLHQTMREHERSSRLMLNGATVRLGSVVDVIDEQYRFVRGSFGEILPGSENSAGYKMTCSAPDVTFLNVSPGSLTFFVPFPGGRRAADVFRRTLATTFPENEGNNDSNRFTCFSPRFSGFQAGVSCARDGRQDSNAQVDEDAEPSNIFNVGANYANAFGDFDIAVSGRYGSATAPGSNPDIWSAGLNPGFAGFKVGGSSSYAGQNDAETRDGQARDAGVSCETGARGFPVTCFCGENVGNGDGSKDATLNADGTTSAATFVAEVGDETLEQYLLGVSCTLAKGVGVQRLSAR